MWLAVGRTDMRKGMNGLALQVQEALGRDPHAGDLHVFRGDGCNRDASRHHINWLRPAAQEPIRAKGKGALRAVPSSLPFQCRKRQNSSS